MYSSVVFLIFATGVVLARSIDDARSKRENSFTEVEPVDCSSDHMREHGSARRNVSCQPFYTHVDLNPMPGQQLSPSSVFVQRCYGHADATAVCAPKSTIIKTIHVSVSSSSQKQQCGVVMVEEHISCEIKCKQGPESCNAIKQEYIPSTCGCRCKNQEELKPKCDAVEGKMWDDENCQCICIASDRNCTSGSKWSEDRCKCHSEG